MVGRYRWMDRLGMFFHSANASKAEGGSNKSGLDRVNDLRRRIEKRGEGKRREERREEEKEKQTLRVNIG